MFRRLNNDKGIALITALMVLAVLTMLGISATLVSSIDMKISGNEKTAIQQQYAAEAGISHGIVWLNKTSLEPSPAPTWATRTNSTFLNWVRSTKRTIMDGTREFSTYSTSISYKKITKGGTDMVAFYNKTSGFVNAPSDTGGWPVYVISSFARRGDYLSQRNVLEVTRKSYDFKVKGGLTAGGNLEFRGTPTLDGRHYDADGNPVTTGAGCRDPDLAQPMPAVYNNGTTIPVGTPNYFASPGITDPTKKGTDVPSSPWDALGIPYDGKPGEDFVSLFPSTQGWPKTYSAGSSLIGDNYYSNFGLNQNITGNGLLIIHNPNFVPGQCGPTDPGYPNFTAPNATDDCHSSKAPAKLDANTGTFKGIIIADQVELKGNVTIIGALISLTTIQTEATGAGTPTIRYSCQAVEKYAGGQINRKLNWRRE